MKINLKHAEDRAFLQQDLQNSSLCIARELAQEAQNAD